LLIAEQTPTYLTKDNLKTHPFLTQIFIYLVQGKISIIVGGRHNDQTLRGLHHHQHHQRNLHIPKDIKTRHFFESILNGNILKFTISYVVIADILSGHERNSKYTS